MTVGLEDLRSRFLDTARKLYKAHVSSTDISLGGPEPRRSIATACSAQHRLHFARLCHGRQRHPSSRHVQFGNDDYRSLQLAAQEPHGVQRERIFVQTGFCVVFVRAE